MKELLRGVCGLLVAAMVLGKVADPVSALIISVFAVIGWLRLFDLTWGTDDGKEKG